MNNTIIFDLDMTIINSLDACTQGANILAKHFGLPEKTEEDVLRAISLPTSKFWEYLWGSFDPTWRDYFAQTIVPQVSHLTTLYPTTTSILQSAKKQDLLLAVATNRINPWHDLAALDLAKYFDTVVGASDVSNPKPDPDILLLVVKQLGISQHEAIFVGDSLVDMASAKAAGIKAIGLLQGGATADELSQAGAWQVCATLEESRAFLGC